MAFEDRKQRAEYQYNLGVPVVFNLPQGLNIIRGEVVIEATVTISGGTTSGTVIGEGGPARLIRRIKVVANKAAGSRYPNGTLVECSPRSLLRWAMNERQGKFVGELGGSTLGNGAAGSYPIYMSIPIYFADSTLYRNMSTALNMNPTDTQGNPVYTAVQVQVDLAATLAELFAGNDRNIAVAGTIRWNDTRVDLSSSDTIPMKQEDHIALIQAAQEEFVDAAMPNDGAFTSWLLMAEQNEPAQALSDAILQRLEIQGSGLNFKENAKTIRQAMIDDGNYDPSSSLVGQYALDWTLGVLGNSNAAAGLQHRIAVANPSGAGLDQLRVYTRRVYGLA